METSPTSPTTSHTPVPADPADRTARGEAVYARLFGPRDTTAPDTDPELGAILRGYIFGDLFATGDLDDRTRELITVTVLAAVQALPQLTAHVHACLTVGASPVDVREALYQLAPYLGFPRTLRAVGAMNEAFTARGIELPLPEQGSVTDADRMERGRAIQAERYGTRMADEMGALLPGGYGQAIAGLLTGLAFGDVATRGGLDDALRELLILCALAALGLQPQVRSHASGARRAGNSVETILAALIHTSGYAGLPLAINALRAAAPALTDETG